MPLFWTNPSTKDFYKITQNSSFSVASPGHSNYNLLGRHVFDRPYSQRNVNDQKHSNLPSLTTRNNTEFKEISVDTYTENRVLRVTVHSLFMTLSLQEKKVSKVQKAVSETSSENTSVNFRINKTSRLIVFNFLSSISSTNKFQVPTTTTNTSFKNTGDILQESDSKQTLQGRTGG